MVVRLERVGRREMVWAGLDGLCLDGGGAALRAREDKITERTDPGHSRDFFALWCYGLSLGTGD